MQSLPVFVLLFPLAVLLSLPAVVDLCAWVVGRARRPRRLGAGSDQPFESVLFLIAAHDEEKLVARCVASLLDQAYPRDCFDVVVIADNCTDATAERARRAGATVLERRDAALRGKHHAIAWALARLPLDRYSAVVLVDADTVVAPDFGANLARHAPLRSAIVQAYNGMSNEFENWLTRMAGVLTRSRYELALPLKSAAGLNCPLAGDGTLIGTDVLKAHPWKIETITEGWELYAAYTLDGLEIAYEPRARFYAQETRSLRQSRSQRQRWTAGRMAVLRDMGRRIVLKRGVRSLQRLDLIAELSSPGPVMRAFFGFLGLLGVVALQPMGAAFLGILFASTIAHPALLGAISLARHPEPVRTLRAFLGLPLYAAWRVAVGLRAMFASGTGAWVRTARHDEPVGPARD